MTLFIICGLVGFVLLLVSLFSGHDTDLSGMDHDFDHGSGDVDSGDQSSVSVFSFRTITVFLTAFGAVGAVANFYGLDMLWSAVSGVAAGFVFGFISWWMMNFAMKQQASSLISISDLIGKSAIVHTSIPKNGIGEIAVEVNGQRKHFSAKSNNPEIEISTNSTVKITENAGGTVLVQLI